MKKSLQKGLLEWKQKQRAGAGCACGLFLCSTSAPVLLCSRVHRDKLLLRTAVPTPQHNPEALSFLLQGYSNKTSKCPVTPTLVFRQGHQTEVPHLRAVPEHPPGSLAALQGAPSSYSSALQYRFCQQCFTDSSVDESVPWLLENFAWVCLIGGFTTCSIWFSVKAIFEKSVKVL